MCTGQPAEQGRLAGVRFADQPHVGDHLQFQRDFALLPRKTGLEFTRSAVHGGGEVLVTPPPFAPLGNDHRIADILEVAEQMPPLQVADQRTGRDDNDRVLPFAAGAQFPLAVPAPFGVPMPMAGDIREAVDVFLSLDNHAPAIAPVAPIRASPGDLRFPTKARTPVAAVTGFGIDDHFVDEHKWDRGFVASEEFLVQTPIMACAGPFGNPPRQQSAQSPKIRSKPRNFRQTNPRPPDTSCGGCPAARTPPALLPPACRGRFRDRPPGANRAIAVNNRRNPRIYRPHHRRAILHTTKRGRDQVLIQFARPVKPSVVGQIQQHIDRLAGHARTVRSRQHLADHVRNRVLKTNHRGITDAVVLKGPRLWRRR